MSKSSPQAYSAANTAISKAVSDAGLPSSWVQPLIELASRESSLDPTAQNKSSTAYGLFQFLNSTWNGTGTTKTSDPTAQAAAAIKYIKSRYGTPDKALAFWDQNNWY